MKYWLIALILILDQLTKFLAVEFLYGRDPVTVVPRFLQLSYATNPGAAFSLFQGHTFLLSLFTLAAILVIAWMARHIPPEQQWVRVGYSLILGGATGNLMDRVARGSAFLQGHVIDFIDAHWMHRAHWPTFNIADSAICIGVACVIIACFVYPRHPETEQGKEVIEGEAPDSDQ